ncbi:MAG: class I SAM-dependent methyltransferase [bacterium]
MTYWEWRAKSYDTVRKLFPFNLILQHEIKQSSALLHEVDLSCDRILDVGAGTGLMFGHLPKSNHLFAVDKSRGMLQRTLRKAHNGSVVADANLLPFKDETFDLVSAVGVFEYQKDRKAFLRELYRVTAASGYLLLTVSQFGFLNLLRNLLAQRVRLIRWSKIKLLLLEGGYFIIGSKKSMIQRQILARRFS